jgi:hypothetical protein
MCQPRGVFPYRLSVFPYHLSLPFSTVLFVQLTMPSKKQTQNTNLDIRTPAQKAAETRRANKAAEEQRNRELVESSEFLYITQSDEYSRC